MILKKLFQTTLLLLIIFISSNSITGKTVNIDEDRYSWYKSITALDVREEIEKMDDQLLGYSNRGFILFGLVQSSELKNGIENAQILIFNLKNKLILKTKTSKNGFFSIRKRNIKKNSITIQVKARGFSTITKTIHKKDWQQTVDFEMIKSNSTYIKAGETKTITDPTNNAKLTIPAIILKRLDNKPIQFPVKIDFSYINPKKNLLSMPGIDMLTEEKYNRISALTSIGAVNIEATDKTGAPVRIDRKKVKQTGKTTRLAMNVKDFLINGKIPKSTRTWAFDKEKGNKSWRKTRNKITLANTISKPPANLSFLKKYAKDIAKRVNNQIEKSLAACFVPANYGDEIRLSKKITDNNIYTELKSFILQDIQKLLQKQKKETTDNCFSYINRYSEDQIYIQIGEPWKIYDIKSKNKWYAPSNKIYKQYKPTNYNKKGCAEYLSYPYGDLTKNFNYSLLLKLKDQICKEYENEYEKRLRKIEKEKWNKAAVVTSIDLVPFNLDTPWMGTPIQIFLSENNGDGKFKAIVSIKSQMGNYEVARIFNTKKKRASLKLLVPSKGNLWVKIYSKFGQKKPRVVREYKFRKSKVLYIWKDKMAGTIVDSKGRKPRWLILGNLRF